MPSVNPPAAVVAVITVYGVNIRNVVEWKDHMKAISLHFGLVSWRHLKAFNNAARFLHRLASKNMIQCMLTKLAVCLGAW